MCGKEGDFARMNWFDIGCEKQKLADVEIFDSFEDSIRGREGRNAGRMLDTCPDISSEMWSERRYGRAVKDDPIDFGVGEKIGRIFYAGKHSNQFGPPTAG